jgi:DNA-binding XRE family transcriptional regulator
VEAGLTQQQVADLAGVDRKTVNRIENNHFSPSVDTIFRLCVTFAKKPSDVFEGL